MDRPCTIATLLFTALLSCGCGRTSRPRPTDAGVLPRVPVNDPVVSEVSIRWRARVLSSSAPTVLPGTHCEFEGTAARTRSGRSPLWLRGHCGVSVVYEPFLEDLGGGPLDHGDHDRCRLSREGDRYRLHCPPQVGPTRTVWSHWLEHRPGDIAVVTHQWLPAWTIRLHWEPLSEPLRPAETTAR